MLLRLRHRLPRRPWTGLRAYNASIHLSEPQPRQRANFNLRSPTRPISRAKRELPCSQTPVLLCPSDFHVPAETRRSPQQPAADTGTTSGPSGYVGVLGAQPGIPVTGVFFENSAIGVQHITDGTSQTVCVSETVISDGTAGIWDGVSPTNGFVLALGGTTRPPGPS